MLSLSFLFLFDALLPRNAAPLSWLARLLLYGLGGCFMEVAWTAACAYRAKRDARLRGHTYVYMLFIYGAGMLALYEPASARLLAWRVPWPARGALYACGVFAVEYASGWLLRRFTGAVPWDYAADRAPSRWQVHGLIRLDYAPCWAAAALLAEHCTAWMLAAV